MPSVLRSVAVFAFVSAVAVLSAPGCSQQGEGERCDNAKNGDLDCDGGLTCVRKGELLEGITDRCCPAAGTESDKRCTRGGPGNTSGGSSSGGSSSGGTATGGTPAAGESSGGAVAVGGTGGEAPGAAGSPPSTDGGMSGGGTPATTDGGAGASSTAGQGGAG
jgi:hypothetical protein